MGVLLDPSINVHHVVASCTADNQIPLSKLARGLERTEYEPEQFPGLVMRLTNPKSAALIFNTGKIVSTGTKSAEEAKSAIDTIIGKIKNLGIDINGVENIRIENMVASSHLGKEINLNRIAIGLEGTEYEPEQFPGLVYRMDANSNIVFLLFSSGKVICTGGKSNEDINKSISRLKEMLKSINEL